MWFDLGFLSGLGLLPIHGDYMSNRKTLIQLQAELMLREMQFTASEKSRWRYNGFRVNWKHAISSNHPVLRKLIDQGLVRLERTKTLHNEWAHEKRRCQAPPRRFTVAVLTKPIPDVIDTTCPGCGNSFIMPSDDKWIIHPGHWSKPVPHTPDCPIHIFGKL